MRTISVIPENKTVAAYFAAKKGYKLLGVSSYKIDKSNLSRIYRTAIVYLAPADSVDGINICPNAARAGCKQACLNTAGRGAMNTVQAARLRKTILYRDSPEQFMAYLAADIRKFSRACAKLGLDPVVRINGTSDIVLEKKHPDLLRAFPRVQFYDYTKIPNRNVRGFPNYHLTQSYSAANPAYARQCMETAVKFGRNIAVVFSGPAPQRFLGLPVVDGDAHDMRFLDPRSDSHVIALSAKGFAKKDTSGFVVHTV